MATTTPILLVFTLGPKRESSRRRLLPQRLGHVEATLHAAGLAAAIEAGRACGCRVRVSSPDPLPLPGGVERWAQGSGSFGRRLAAALESAFAETAGPVIVVGTDVPGLAAGQLRRALEGLRADARRVVLGPSPDGGIYLLAAARPIAELLSAVAWCGRETLAQLSTALSAAGFEIELLEPLADLDRPRDLEAWLARRRASTAGPWQPLRRLLHRLLAALRRPLLPPVPHRLLPAAATASAGRAPPA